MIQPVTAAIDNEGQLTIGGLRIVDLVREYGSPYISWMQRRLDRL